MMLDNQWVKRPGMLGRAVCAALALLAATPVAALAQGFVTGSANTDGFSIVGWLRLEADGSSKGEFTIIVHKDVPENPTAAAVCTYKTFDDAVIAGSLATFHSVGVCWALTTSGARLRFTSDNRFAIADQGEPGAGHDAVDVNLISGSGLTIPGAFLVDGNFIVSP